ncbi:MAG: DUF5049 domain-containing protein [Acidobacteriota bacterium]|nr:DUF5049 domain-containing protein [Acidobacteriota bacterium]
MPLRRRPLLFWPRWSTTGLAVILEREDRRGRAFPAVVWQGIDAVRLSGLTNMLDRPAVVRIAGELGFPEAARWIEDPHRRNMPKAFSGSFIVEAEGGKP